MESSRTIFSMPTQDDFQDLAQLYANTEVRKYLGGPVTADQFAEIFQKLAAAEGIEKHWVVREKKTNAFIGEADISRHHDGKHYELSYMLSPAFWSKGFGTEIAERVLKYAFDELGLDELYAETQQANEHSVKLLTKLGMQEVARVERFSEPQVIFGKRK
jgi:ribosomal-protein-alanine N-acetyltransferase